MRRSVSKAAVKAQRATKLFEIGSFYVASFRIKFNYSALLKL